MISVCRVDTSFLVHYVGHSKCPVDCGYIKNHGGLMICHL